MSRNFHRCFSQQNSYDHKSFEKRLREAFLRGINQGRNEGYDNGFIDGQHQGYQDGYENGYENCKSKIQNEIQQSYEIGNENGYKNGYEAGYDKREEEINGSTITFYIPSVVRADASTMTMESTEIKITTAHAETMTETTTTYDMIMTTEIEPEHLSTPSTTSYSKLDIESATHILTTAFYRRCRAHQSPTRRYRRYQPSTTYFPALRTINAKLTILCLRTLAGRRQQQAPSLWTNFSGHRLARTYPNAS